MSCKLSQFNPWFCAFLPDRTMGRRSRIGLSVLLFVYARISTHSPRISVRDILRISVKALVIEQGYLHLINWFGYPWVSATTRGSTKIRDFTYIRTDVKQTKIEFLTFKSFQKKQKKNIGTSGNSLREAKTRHFFFFFILFSSFFSIFLFLFFLFQKWTSLFCL